jgi:methionyl-tRNA formyltransferase
MPDRLRVVVFGMRGVGSLPVLRELLAAGHDVRAVVMPGPPGLRTLPPMPSQRTAVPMAGAGTDPGHLDELARSLAIPVLLAGRLRRPEVVEAIVEHEPDLIAVSCFPTRIPAEVLGLPRLGCLNVHPSLLPVGRGPEPVFWTLRRGDAVTGVTVHLMVEGFDSGPILLQEEIEVPVGVRLPEFERVLAEIGARLLIRVIAGLARGEITGVPQDDRLATTAPIPTADDFLLPTDHTAEWAYRFARAVAPLEGPLAVLDVITGERVPIRDAIDWEPEGVVSRQRTREAETVTIPFRAGSVRFALPGEARQDRAGARTGTSSHHKA